MQTALKRGVASIALATVLLLFGCGGSPTPTPTITPDGAATLAALSV
jgi:hypothetical protein